jgi:ADP-ribose pyrophosphatase YjhB (NUDIX family)
MHEVQRGILKRLSTRVGLRFSEIKPKGVESNRFMYHLRSLIDGGYVKKVATLYRLTSKGKSFVDRVSSETFEERIQPKIVTLVICKNKRGEYLLYRRGKQPFLGKVGFPYGKIHMGERVLEAAERELQEKTGLSAPLVYRGDVYITVHDEEDLVTQMLCHVFSGTEPKGDLLVRSPIGSCYWGLPEKVSKSDEIPGFSQVFQLSRGPAIKPFFKEYFLDIHED